MNTAPNSKITVGLVGYGYWGPNLLRNLISHGSFHIVGVVDFSEEARTNASKIYPQVPTFADLKALYSNKPPQAMVIATPPSTHKDIAIDCMNGGSHILIEKPMAASTGECDEILTIAEKTSRKVMVDHTFVYNPAVQYLSKQIQSNSLGKLLYFDSVRVNLGKFQTSTNVLWDLAPHDLSIIDLFTGGKKPLNLIAIGTRHFDGSGANLCHLHLTYENNFTCHLHLNWISPIKIRTVTVTGSEKMAVYDDNLPTEKVKIYDKSIVPQSEQDFRVDYRIGDMVAQCIPTHEALAEMVSQFHKYIAQGEAPVSDGRSGRRIVEILQAAELSMAQEGKLVSIDDSTDLLETELAKLAA